MTEKVKDKLILEGKLVLKLYVSGMSSKSMEAIRNIKLMCDEYFSDCFELEIIDIFKNPKLASQEHIVFSPSLLKEFPLPKKNFDRNIIRHRKSIESIRRHILK